jgi:putative ABC transport system permease protein
MTSYLKLAAKNILRHRTRSVLTMLGIAASVGVLFAVLSFNKGFTEGLALELERTGLHFMIVPSGCAHEVAALVLHGAVIPKFLDTGVMEHVGALTVLIWPPRFWWPSCRINSVARSI